MAMSEKEKRHRLSRGGPRAAQRAAAVHRSAAQGVDHSARAFARLTMYLPDGGQVYDGKKEMLDQLVVIMGGRVAEELVFGDVTSGASATSARPRADALDGLRTRHEREARHGQLRRERGSRFPWSRPGPLARLQRGDRARDRPRGQAILRRRLQKGHRDHPHQPRKLDADRQGAARVRDSRRLAGAGHPGRAWGGCWNSAQGQLSAATPMPPTPTKDPGARKRTRACVIAPDYPAGLS